MEAYLYDTVRTPRGKGNAKGALAGCTATHLATGLLHALRHRHDLNPTEVEELILGCVTQIHDQGANVAKTIAQQSGYGNHLTGFTLNRFCGSGLEAINQAAANVKAGYYDLIVAGGVESMSRTPIGSDGGAIMVDPSVALSGHYIPQGVSADLIATKYGYSRSDVDQFALASQQRATAAWQRAAFQRSIVPVRDSNGLLLLEHDENVRPHTNLERLGQLQPAFAKMGQQLGFDAVALSRYPELEQVHHVHHAGNSSAIVDGAAIALIGNRAVGKRLGIRPRAVIRAIATCGTDPTMMLVGPAPASRKALQRAGMSPSDLDLIEVNEAFSAVALRFMDDLGVDHSQVNVNGGAIALGHPLGATGCMLAGTLLDELEARNLTTGLITLCIGGGMGIATIIERI